MEDYYHSFNGYLRQKFGDRVQRLSLDAGLGCPNRDGKISREGCIFCNEKAFSPYAGGGLTLRRQIEESMEFARRRYKASKFIAYFQAGTNTYGPVSKLKETYGVIRKYPDIVGLYISTRPDCVDEKKLDMIREFSGDYEVWMEYGLQSAHERTLKFTNRCHTFHDFVRAVNMTFERGIKSAAHVILGLPGETTEDMLKTAEKISGLPVEAIKFHALHVLKDTKLADYFERNDIRLLSQDEYVSALCSFLERVPPEVVIFRIVSDAKQEYLIAPRWINRKEAVIKAVNSEFERRSSRQGRYCKRSFG